MKKCLFLFICLLYFSSIIMSAPLRLDEMETMYKQAYQLEQLKLFSKSRDIYLDLTDSLITNWNQGRTKNIKALSLAIGAAFRLSIVTSKENYQQLHQLIDRVTTFEETDAVINHLINIVQGIRLSDDSAISRNVYEVLFFARAYNRLGWANQVLHGIAWKNYIVFPIGDIVQMQQSAIEDLEQYLQFLVVKEHENYNENKQYFFSEEVGQSLLSSYETYFSELFTTMTIESPLYHVYRYSNSQDKPDILVRILAKRTYNQAYKLLQWYYSPDVQKKWQQSKHLYTIEEILDKNNQWLFKLSEKMVSFIGITK